MSIDLIVEAPADAVWDVVGRRFDRIGEWATAILASAAVPAPTPAQLPAALRPGGLVGLADLVRRGPLPPGLNDLHAWIACIAGARPAGEYVQHLRAAGLEVVVVEDHDRALADLVRRVRIRLLGAAVATRLERIELPGADLARAREMARDAELAVLDGRLG